MSGWGVRVKRAGVVEMDNLTDMGRIVGLQEISAAAGSITNSALTRAYPYAVLMSLSPLPYWLPTLSISGDTIAWDYGSAPANSPGGSTRTPCAILYGTTCVSYGGATFSPASEAARWGARVKHGSSRAVQIDDQYSNLALLQKATLSASSSIEVDSSRYKATITVTSVDTPVLAISSTATVALWSVARSGSDWTYTFYADTAGASITAYLFGKPTVLGAGWGARIKRGGVICWDNRHRYARIATVISGTGIGGGSSTLTSGKTYAVVIGLPAGQWDYVVQAIGGSGFTSTETRQLLGVSIASNVIAWSSFTCMFQLIPGSVAGPARSYNRLYGKYSFLVLDVTNY